MPAESCKALVERWNLIMSVLQRTIQMFVLAAAAVAGQFGWAEAYHPFAEPMSFDPDWQFFAPAQLQDLDDLTARQRANTGFFLTYDFVHYSVSRSTTEAGSYQLDGTWGNRVDFGWMKDNESGWAFSVQNFGTPGFLKSTGGGVAAYNQYEQQRLSGNVDADNNDPTDPFIPLAFGNDPEFGERLFIIRDSLNVASFTSLEANKTWRLEPYRYGGILEPLMGLRYANFNDTAHNDVYDTFPVLDGAGAVTAQAETMLRDDVSTRNDMILGQIGFRYTKFVKRWTLSNDFKVFAGHNFQTQSTSRLFTTTTYSAAPALGDTPTFDNDNTGTTYSGRKGQKTVVGFDLRAEASYKATKYIDVRGGFQMLYFGKGIWRGSTVTEGGNQFANDQRVWMPGFTFGVALNR